MVQWTVPIAPSLRFTDEIARARDQGRPVVALESSVIAQGLPRPANVDAALRCEAAVRAAGAVPATLAVIDGTIRVGLSEKEIRALAADGGVEKAGARDLGRLVATHGTAATTVGASLIIARAARIDVFATGGIGGVHRGADTTDDVSHDVQALASVAAITVCSGAKSILDLPHTLERLETLGVPVVGYRTDRFPAFYAVDSGLPVPRIDEPATAWRMLGAQQALGISAGIVVANPPPSELALDEGQMEATIAQALQAAAADGIAGKQVTPYLLAYVARRTEGRSVDLNVALLVANARLAAEIAVAGKSGV